MSLRYFCFSKMTWNSEAIKANMVIVGHVTIIHILITKRSSNVRKTCNVWQSKSYFSPSVNMIFKRDWNLHILSNFDIEKKWKIQMANKHENDQTQK